jgi:hypothetical protein
MSTLTIEQAMFQFWVFSATLFRRWSIVVSSRRRQFPHAIGKNPGDLVVANNLDLGHHDLLILHEGYKLCKMLSVLKMLSRSSHDVRFPVSNA